MAQQNTRLGIILMVITTFIFAVQDGISGHLAREYNVFMVVMIRFWFFAAFVIVMASRATGGVRGAAKTSIPILQITRGALLVFQICVMIYGFTLLGLVESHVVFAIYPLLAAALSGPVLGEYVGWRRWAAIVVGFIGVVIILEPGYGVFKPAAVVPLIGALMFALYGLLTRYAGRVDSAATSFFWTGIIGSIVMTIVGVWFWEPMSGGNWVWMGILCITGALGHYTLIKCYELAEVTAVQPFAYFQLVFAAAIGVTIFSETIRSNVAIGATIIVAAGLFTLWRQRQAG